MRTDVRSLTVALVAVPLVASLSVAQQANLKVGDKAPDFKLMGSDGKEYSLAQFAGAKAVALCWFPRAGSNGAKNQCASLEAIMPNLPADKVQVFGCSTVALDVTTAFAQQGKYSFPVLSDAGRAAVQAYGCMKADGSSERWTFLIDDKGVLLAINKNTSPQTQGTDLVKMLTDGGLIGNAANATQTPAAPDPLAVAYLERTWTAVTLQLACSDAQQAGLKVVYASELQTRNDALAQALGKRDMTAVQTALDTCRSNLDTKLKATLTTAQWQQLQTLMQPPAPPN